VNWSRCGLNSAPPLNAERFNGGFVTYRDSQNVENAFSFCYNTFSIFSHGSFALGTTTPRAFIFTDLTSQRKLTAIGQLSIIK